LKYLNGEDKKQAKIFLEEVASRFKPNKLVYANKKFKHRLWFAMSKISLSFTCRVRNMLNCGF
jgi:hypothetical protein